MSQFSQWRTPPEWPVLARVGHHTASVARPLRGMLLSLLGVLVLVLALAVGAPTASAADPCAPVTSVIACENSKPGNPASEWQVSGAGSTTIQGFATSMSVNPGDTVRFKIKTPATRYHIDVYRMGYYQGNGARKVAAGVLPSATLPQTQPACLNDTAATGLIDCGNWAVSASWAVPSTAVSGVYFARLVRDDTTGTSQIVFVVRNDASHSDLIVQTSDETWQAYNSYGGNSLYTCTSNCPPGNPAAYKGAAKVSYNRPFHSAEDDNGHSWLTWAEYPMIRFLEANGFDVSYTSGLDVGTTAGGSLLTTHKVFLSSGHDEYWSGPQRANVEAARDAGVNLAFFSGNEVFWKTRWEPSIDASATANRTLVSYKETHYDGSVDPQDPPTWTGTWQDPRFSPPADGGRPQNALTGQLFVVNSGTTDIRVPAQYGKLRLWRGTAAANLTGTQTLTLGSGQGTLGYEWDVEPDNGFRPAGLFDVSSTTSTTAESFTDYGSTTRAGSTATHRMSLYRAPSGALVFGAGTVQWAFGLDAPGSTPNTTMRQATVNLLADMGAQPYALAYSGLSTASRSTDGTAPTSSITSPAAGAGVGDGAALTVSGTATDAGGGVVAGVEVSTDGGTTWHPATGTTSWSYAWVAHGSPGTTIRTRAVDDSGNLEVPSAGRSLDVGCSCSIWGAGRAPTLSDSGSNSAVEVGVKFRSDVSGSVTGVRFYKSTKNTGTHVGNLWTSSGTKLASVTFTGESASGWQQATFATPVSVNANTTYVVSYFAPAGHTAQDDDYLYPNPSPRPDLLSFVDSPPLHALRNVSGTVNGLFRTGTTSGFPTSSQGAPNYWVDVMFNPNTGPATVPGTPTGVSATPGDASAALSWTPPGDGGSAITGYTVTPYIGTIAQTPRTVSGSPPATSTTVTGLTNGTAYTFRVAATNAVGTGPASPASNSLTPAPVTCAPCTLWPSTAVPPTPDEADTNATEIGVKFRSDVTGQVTGIRFYKATANIGTHIGNLWTTSGTRLATVTFSGESGSGWQQANFATPVPITAGTTYVASYYAPKGHYAGDGGFFAGTGVDSGPLHAPADGVEGGNGVYRYSSSSAFPSSTFESENYWVDVVFATVGPTAPAAPTSVAATAGDASATVSWTAPADGGSPITGYTVTPYIGTTAQTAKTVTGSPPGTSTTVTGLTNGTAYTFRVAATNAVGTGPASAPSATVTPAGPTAPAAPTSVAATAGDASATVSWTAPADGGSPITGYTVTPYIGTTAQTAKTVTGSPPGTSTTVTGLTNGTAYTFRVAATNAVGTGPASAPSATVTPAGPTAPAAPTSVAATAGDASATVSWTAPADGGSPITGYTVTPYIGTTAQTAKTVTGSPPGTSTTVTGLTNGTAYTFRVAATNAVGTGPASAPSATVTPAGPTAPAAPTAVTATAADSSATVTWTAPADGGSPITSYTITPYAGTTAQAATTLTGSPPVTSTTITGLTNDTAYTFTVTATNAVGTGPASAASTTITPTASATAPAAPTSVTATAGDASATVTWTAPADGGSLITGYTVTPFVGTTAQTPKTVTGSPPGTTTTVTALTNGTAYTFTVTATNAVGTGPASAASIAVTPTAPATAPDAPVGVTATAGDGAATVSWTAPADGGSPITGYTVTPYAGTTAQTTKTVTGSPPGTTTTVAGLTNGTAYTFTVTATNAVGTGPASAASTAVTPTPGGCSACTIWPSSVVPANPDVADNGAVELGVKFTSDTSGQVTGIRFYKGAGNTGTHTGNLWTTSGTRLATVTFTAESSSGWQQASFATPVAITAGTTYVASYFAPNGNYAADGGYFTTGMDRAPLHALRDGLDGGNGVYQYGSASAFPGNTYNSSNYWVDVVFATVPATVPETPSSVAATAGDGAATVSWTAPADGGSPITGYTVTPYVGTTAQTAKTVTGSPPGTSTTVTGLTNGTAYTFRVAATNAVGTGPASAPSATVTPAGPTAPAAPTAVTATGADSSASVSWTAPADGGSPITGYIITPYAGTTAQAATTLTGSPPVTSTTITGLTNDTAYTFTVTATNAVGTGPASAASTTITPTAGGCSACTVWPATAAPANPSANDSSSVELGVKLSSDVSGFVTGIRFYKGTGNTGTHVGNLWTTSGTRLATVTFTGETATGWQQANFATPLAVTAGTVYVASYLAPRGHYAGDNGYFTTATDRAPLHALRDGASGGNGVYRYGSTSAFPSNTWQSSNYWVDVVFRTP